MNYPRKKEKRGTQRTNTQTDRLTDRWTDRLGVGGVGVGGGGERWGQ